jgi:hypothetical protein
MTDHGIKIIYFVVACLLAESEICAVIPGINYTKKA